MMVNSEQKMKNGKFFPRSHLSWDIKHRLGAIKIDNETEEIIPSDGHLMMMKKHQKNKWIPLDILWTDYTDHVLLYSCSLSWGGLIKSERSWVMTRKPLMPYNGYLYDNIREKSKQLLTDQDEITNFDFDEAMRPVN